LGVPSVIFHSTYALNFPLKHLKNPLQETCTETHNAHVSGILIVAIHVNIEILGNSPEETFNTKLLPKKKKKKGVLSED